MKRREQADVMRAPALCRRLGMRKSRFYLKLRAGAFRHLEAPGPSAVLGYTVYSVTRVATWIESQAPLIRLARKA